MAPRTDATPSTQRVSASTWWLERDRLHIAGFWGAIVLRPVDRPCAGLDVLPDDVERLLDAGDHDREDLHYLLFGQAVGRAQAQVGLHLEIPVLDAVERALAEKVELSERQIWLKVDQRLRRDLDLEPQLLDQKARERVEVLAGVGVIHGCIPFEQRIRARARAAGRAALIEDMVASRARRAAGIHLPASTTEAA